MPALAVSRQMAPEVVTGAREKLIVALDFHSIAEAEKLVLTLGDEVEFYKVGLGLQLAGGDVFARDLLAMKKKVFLDYKYYDIEETIRNAVYKAANMGVDFLTVHGPSGILKAAVEGKGSSELKIFCVTLLTSMDIEDLYEMGHNMSVENFVLHRALKAMDAGCDGVIASAKETKQLKYQTRNKLMVVNPGIRPEGSKPDDQKRKATPFDAITAGADYLVIGRPITAANDPLGSARAIISEIQTAVDYPTE